MAISCGRRKRRHWKRWKKSKIWILVMIPLQKWWDFRALAHQTNDNFSLWMLDGINRSLFTSLIKVVNGNVVVTVFCLCISPTPRSHQSPIRWAKRQHPNSKSFILLATSNIRYMDKRILLQLNGPRKVTGVMRGYDPFMNIVLDECVEESLSSQKTEIGMVVWCCIG